MRNGNKSNTCRVCSRKFSSQKDLQQHCAAVGHLSSNQSNNRRGSPKVNHPRTNFDGSAYVPGQARQEQKYGSSSGGSSLRADDGIKEAVAAIIGDTPEGRAWALAALHPCGAGEVINPLVGTMNGMCDTMTSSVATPSYRSESYISYSQDLFINSITMPTTYGIDIIIPPVPEIDFIYRLKDDSTNQATGWIVVRLPQFELPPKENLYSTTSKAYGYDYQTSFTTMAAVGYGKLRQIAVGHTIELDAAALNNQGRIVAGQMEGQWKNYQLNPPHIDARTSKFVTQVDPLETASAITSIEESSSGSSCNVWSMEVPVDPAVLVANCPNAYQGMAKHGAYVVQKFTSPLLGYSFKRTGTGQCFRTDDKPISFKSGDVWPVLPNNCLSIDTTEGALASLTNADGFYDSDDPSNKFNSSFGYGVRLPVKGNLDQNVNANAIHPGISEPSDMMTAVILLRNLPAGGSSGNTASLRVKSRNFYEAVSNGTNAAVALTSIHQPHSIIKH